MCTEGALREVKLTISTLDLFDELTCLYKRDYLLTRLHQECQRSKRYRHPVAFLLIDIDNFGAWNDCASAGEGDSLLQEIASTILGIMREIDLIGRFGDDEFGVLLPETSLEDALVAAERVRHAIETEFFDRAKSQPVTVSVGVAALSEPEEMDPDIFTTGASEALRLAKEQGRNRAGICPETALASRR